MTNALAKGLSEFSVKLAIPCLLFSSVVPGISPTLLAYGWPLMLLPAVYLLLGAPHSVSGVQDRVHATRLRQPHCPFHLRIRHLTWTAAPRDCQPSR